MNKISKDKLRFRVGGWAMSFGLLGNVMAKMAFAALRKNSS